MLDDLEFREATLDDLPEITALFRDTIRTVNSKDYNDRQIEVWASGADKLKKWQKRIKNNYFLVAELHNQIVGFSSLKNGNHLDHLFVHKDFQRQTIASKLLRIMESKASMEGYERMTSDVSITALPFFDSHFYEVEKKQNVSAGTITLENYLIYKDL